MGRLRWAKFFWADWAGDNALSLCSHTAQSVWLRLLCIAAQNEPYGTVLIGGRQPTDGELAALMRPRMRVSQFRRCLAELERKKVAKRDPNGDLFSARLRRDGDQSRTQSAAGTISAQKRKINNLGIYGVATSGTKRLRPEAEADESVVSPKGKTTDSSAPDARSAERVVRFDGARAQHHALSDDEKQALRQAAGLTP